MIDSDDESIGFPTSGEMMGAHIMVLTALIEELKSKGLVDGESLARRIESLVDERNANNNGIKLFTMIARRKHDDLGL